MESFNELVKIVKTLRDPGGCPWDREQTHSSLTQYAIEEAHELEEAINNGDVENMKEELGDLLFQSILHAQIASENQQFNIDDVLKHLNHKMVTRHPHVFGDSEAANKARTPQEVMTQWEAIKAQEKDQQKAQNNGSSPTAKDPMDVPKTFPALLRAQKIGKRTAKLKFDWENPEAVFAKVQEEIAELQEAIATQKKSPSETRKAHVEEELGDLLFSVAQWARHLELDAETALRKGNEKFITRFRKLLQKNPDFAKQSSEAKEELWRSVKAEEPKPS